MATAKQRAWRKKFAAMYGGKKKKSRRNTTRTKKRSSRTRRVRTMARRRSTRRRSALGLGSVKGIASKAAVGIGVASFFPGMLGAAVAAGIGGIPAGAAALFAPQIRNMIGQVAGGAGMNAGGWE